MKSAKKPYKYHLELEDTDLWEAIDRVKLRSRTEGEGFLSKREIIEQALSNDPSIKRELREMGWDV